MGFRAGLTSVLLLGAILGAGTLVTTDSAHAASFAVDSALDAVDAVPGDGHCATALGHCTLRAAVQETNALPGADSISVPAGNYLLSIAGPGEDASATGDLDVTDHLSIGGANVANTIIDGGHLDRVFHVDPVGAGTVEVDLSNLTVQNGSVTGVGGGGILNVGRLVVANAVVSGNTSDLAGGGISNGPGSFATVVDSMVIGNSGGAGGSGPEFCCGGIAVVASSMLTVIRSTIGGNFAGGIGGAGIGSTGTVELVDSYVVDNSTSGTAGGIGNGGPLTLIRTSVTGNTAATEGGGIFTFAETVVRTSTISDNTAGTDGGGIWNASELRLEDSSITDNSALLGGGMFNSGTMSLSNSVVGGNFAANSGGVINFGTLRVAESMILSNTSEAGAGGIGSAGILMVTGSTFRGNASTGPGALGGGIASGINSAAMLSVSDSTFTQNHAGQAGGGIASGGTLNVTNSTISANSSDGNGGGIALAATPATVTLNNVTITENTSDRNGDGNGNGGGIATAAVAPSLSNTIVAGNSDSGGQAPDCAGGLASQGFNLVQTTGGCEYVSGPGDVTGQPANLGPLAYHGGLTQTHALLPGSPAIDAGNPAMPGSGAPACEATDQRGVARPLDGDGDRVVRCDVGAFEREGQTTSAGKVTGGGNIDGSDPAFSATGDLLSLPALTTGAAGDGAAGGEHATFGFVVKGGATPSGNLHYVDPGSDVEIKATSIDTLAITGSHAEFSGHALVNGDPMQFRALVDDLGEPGTADTLRIEVTEPGGYANGPRTLVGGNIKILR